MVVIGVTGTNGKSSTVLFIAKLLEELGQTVGYTGTAGFAIGGREVENRMKMTMPGRFLLQRMMREMVEAKCGYAIIETSSEGIAQFRHKGIAYDVAVFTNLTPEHIESHGGFENYKKAKGKLFAHLMSHAPKVIHEEEIERVSVVNRDDEHAPFFASFPADRHVGFGKGGSSSDDQLVVSNVEQTPSGASMKLNDVPLHLKLHAEFQQANALAAISAVYALGFDLRRVCKAAHVLEPLAGRFELIDQGQPFKVIVDYAYEPYAIKALLDATDALKPKRIIGVHGSCGGGRDVARREPIGRLAAQREDIVIVTNEDPYDEDPRVIIEMVADGARAGGKVEGEDLFLIDDRMDGIQKAIDLAKPGDAVLVTAKGSETVMAVAGGVKAPWSDREAARKALRNRGFV